MSAPLSLRVCCMAAMAPALTEAASHSHIKLSDTSPPVSLEPPIPLVNGSNLGTNHAKDKSASTAKGKQSLVGFTSHLTLHQLQQAHKQGLLKPVGCNQITSANLKNFKLVNKLQPIGREKESIYPVLNKNGTYKILDNCEKMNKLVPVTNSTDAVKQDDQRSIQTISKSEKKEDVKHIDIKSLTDKVDLPSLKSDESDNCEKTVSNLNNKIPDERETRKLVSNISETDNNHSNSKMVASSGNGPDVNVTDLKPVDDQTDSKQIDNASDSVLKTDPKLDLYDEVSKKQHSLERRTQHLLRRLRRVQGRQLESHIRHQLSSFVSFQNSNLQTVAKSIKSNNSNVDLKTDLFQSEDVKSLSTAALVNLVQRLQSSNQNSLPLNQRLVTPSKTEKDAVPQGVLAMDEEMCAESNRVAGHLGMNLSHMQSALDSDATESSSGGESCDEDDIYYDRDCKAIETPLHRRAEWKWATERANVASRWTWLQAQVSDLEYRIRQQSEIFKHIRHTKGSVVLGEPQVPEDLSSRLKQSKSDGQRLSPLDAKIANLQKKNEVSPCNISTILMNVNMQASKLTKSLGNCYSPVQGGGAENKLGVGNNHSAKTGLNGVINSSEHGLSSTSGASNSGDNSLVASSASAVGPSGDNVSAIVSPEISSPPDLTCQAARCRPVLSYRKRKLLRTAGLHQWNRKAARLSTVKCQCSPPVDFCPMCGGRYNNTQSVDPDTQPVQERVSILDPAFHPVLSFHQEIPLPVHFEALLKSGEWQNKPPPKSAKAVSAERRRQKMMMSSVRERVNKKTKYAKGAAAALLSSAKLRNKYERRTPTKPRGSGLTRTPKKKTNAERRLARSDLKRRRAAQLAIAALKRNEGLSSSLPDSLLLDSRSPQFNKDGTLSTSCPTSTLKEMKEAAWRKRRESAYDINNIVIPYSMAASTRVEKLQYKEIVTPKWRDLTEDDTKPEASPNPTVTETNSESKEVDSVVQSDMAVAEEDEIEDISEEAFAERHMICEIQEKKRFTSFIQYPSRRSRGSRGDDRGPATPDPASPDSSLNESQFMVGTPAVTMTASHVTKDEAFRRRSSSGSRRQSIQGDENGQAIEFIDFLSVDPWPERSFPLSEEEYEQMKMVQPPPIPQRRTRIPSSRMSLLSEFGATSKHDLDSTPGSSRPCSPLPSSSSGSVVGEDPNDPEWTMVNGDGTQHKQPVVMKVAKR